RSRMARRLSTPSRDPSANGSLSSGPNAMGAAYRPDDGPSATLVPRLPVLGKGLALLLEVVGPEQHRLAHQLAPERSPHAGVRQRLDVLAHQARHEWWAF